MKYVNEKAIALVSKYADQQSNTMQHKKHVAIPAHILVFVVVFLSLVEVFVFVFSHLEEVSEEREREKK
jgi:hypothetical protein